MNTTNQKTKVAIIGLGNIGRAIATNLIKGNHPVIISSREMKKAQSLATQLGTLATAEETAKAIKDADVIIPTIYFEKIKEFLEKYAKELKGKVIIDVSNPIAPDGKGGFKKIINKDVSAGQVLSALIPKDAIFVKAFGTLAFATLIEAAFTEPDRKVLFYASDSTIRNTQIEELITDSGFEPMHVGSINQSIRIEVLGDLHEFGALGKTITLQEAKNLLNLPQN